MEHTPGKCALDFPARTLVSIIPSTSSMGRTPNMDTYQVQFLHNHHLLQLIGKPSWLTIFGGRYV